MKVKVTTEIDMSLKMMFEAHKEPDKPTYKQFLESGILEYMKKRDPIKALQQSIEIKERELQEQREELARLRVLEPYQKRIAQYEAKEQDQQRLLHEWFDQDPERIVRTYDRHAINFKHVAPIIGALSARQAQEWIIEVVKNWKAQHENGVKI